MGIPSLLRAVTKRNLRIEEINRKEAYVELQRYGATHFDFDFDEPVDKVITEYLIWKKRNKQGTFESWYKQRK